MLPAAQPNGACHLTPKPPLPNPPAPPLPCAVAMAACSPSYSELWFPKKTLSYEIVLCVLL